MHTRAGIIFLGFAICFICNNLLAYSQDVPKTILQGEVSKNSNDLTNEIVFIPNNPPKTINDILRNHKKIFNKVSILNSTKNKNSKKKAIKPFSFIKAGNVYLISNLHNNIEDTNAQSREIIKKAKNGVYVGDNAILLSYAGENLEKCLFLSALRKDKMNDNEAYVVSKLSNYPWNFVLQDSFVKHYSSDSQLSETEKIVDIPVYEVSSGEPANTPFLKVAYSSKKVELDLSPQVAYDFLDKSIKFGALIEIK